MSASPEKQSVGGNLNLSAGYERKEQVRCMFCGGKECSKCGLEAYKKVAQPAIELLHSHWITDKIVGMQRPNESSLQNGALDDMVKKKVTAIFNLTEPGEHPFCGCGNMTQSGFPYLPETVMARGIKHFNFHWRDMTVPTLDMMDRIVAIACHEIQNGGKIAIHCHAGFGRTGLAIACIMIANDQLSADSVITFVRNRRPGSIQTAQQQKFIHKYERHRELMLQIFPTYEELEEGRSKTKSFVAYPKTISISVEDQQHFFSQADHNKPEYRYLHKVVHLSSRAISRMSFDQFNVACLAITGLNKLTVKRNSIDAGRDADAHAARAESLTSRPQLLRKKSSFMVATNSLSESSEESMLIELKLELNQNNFTRITSLVDVISADFRARGESLSKLEVQVSKRIMEAGQGRLDLRKSASKRSLTGSQRGLGVSTKLTRELSHIGSESSSQPFTPHSEGPYGRPDQIPPANGNLVMHHLDLFPEISTKSENATATETQPQFSPPHSQNPAATSSSPVVSTPSTHTNDHPLDLNTTTIMDDKSVKTGEASTTAIMKPRLSYITTNVNVEHDSNAAGVDHHSSHHSSSAYAHHTGSSSTGPSPHSNKESPIIPRMSIPSPGSMIRGLSARSMNNDNSQSNVTGNSTQRSNTSTNTNSGTSPLTVIRTNSLRMNTEQDYAKSKKMATNLISQLLLDWLETRSDAIFNAESVDQLQDIWAKYGGIPKVTEDKLNEEGGSTRSLSEKGANNNATASAVPVASSPGEIQEDFYEDELIQAVYGHVTQHLSRYQLELLSSLVEMYRFIRLAGFDHTVKLQAKAQEQASTTNPAVNNHHPLDAHPTGSAGSTGSETQALDALVGLRLTIAAMHARKKNSNLVRRRGLIIDLVKVFLLKSSSSEYVIINNITFSAENFAQIQSNIGMVLLSQIDVIFRTLNLLVDTQWSSSWKKVRGKHRGRFFDSTRVGWRDASAVQDFNDEDFSSRSRSSKNG